MKTKLVMLILALCVGCYENGEYPETRAYCSGVAGEAFSGASWYCSEHDPKKGET